MESMDEAGGGWPERVLIAGCGDIGLRVARRLVASGREVTAIVRDPQKAEILRQAGVAIRLLDLDVPQDAGDWPLVFWFAPPPGSGPGDARLRGWLAAQRGRLARLVYLSTSGVYGDCQGRWIDEDEPLRPQADRARRRVDAEQALADWRGAGRESVVLRVPGIYGPGRLPEARLRQKLPVLRPEDSPYSNRVHAEDLAEATLIAAQRGRDGAAYHVADGSPTTMADYFTRCARLLGLPDPPVVDLDEARRVFTPAMWSYVEESKRLRIDRLREELGFAPRYPDLATGLAACVLPAEPAGHGS